MVSPSGRRSLVEVIDRHLSTTNRNRTGASSHHRTTSGPERRYLQATGHMNRLVRNSPRTRVNPAVTLRHLNSAARLIQDVSNEGESVNQNEVRNSSIDGQEQQNGMLSSAGMAPAPEVREEAGPRAPTARRMRVQHATTRSSARSWTV